VSARVLRHVAAITAARKSEPLATMHGRCDLCLKTKHVARGPTLPGRVCFNCACRAIVALGVKERGE
jgi:hypothetical protein